MMFIDPLTHRVGRPPTVRRAAAVVIGLACATAFAQDDDMPAKTDGTVYVRDSGVAVEKLALGERLEKQKEWDKSAGVYLEVAQKFADRVVPSRKDAAGRPTQYVSAARVVQDRIAHWPPEGVAAYRRRYEDTARDLLNSDDPAATARVADLYFSTDAGRDASLKLMSDAFERGDAATAAAIGRRLLDAHPGLAAERPRVLLQTGIAEHLAGRDDDAKARLEELKSRFADTLARVGGTDTKAVDALAAVIETPTDAPTFRSENWPTPFGSPDAAAVPEQVSGGGARLFGIDIPGPVARGQNGGNLKTFQQAVTRDRNAGLMTGILPSVDEGALFFQDNARVYAIGLASGLPLPGWQQTYPGTGRGAFAIDAAPSPRGKQLAVSVAGQNVVAIVGQVDSAVQQIGYPMQPPQLVCLDRVTGRRNWSALPARLKLPDTLSNLRESIFYGTPVVSGDTVYALVNANRGNQFEECYLIALSLKDGGFRWATYVASTSLGRGMNMGMDEGGDPFSTGVPAAVSLAGDRLYVLTNLGALACLDAGSGQVRWLNTYPRTPALLQRRLPVLEARMASKPYALAPPIIADGRVFVMPTDSPSLIICDALDGSVIRELPRKLGPKQQAQSLLGVIGDSVFLANRSTVFRVPWKTYDVAKTLVENDGRFKNFPASADDKSDDSIRGRPFLAAKSVLVPTAERLYRVSLETFKTEAEYPPQAQGKWDDDESPGNVLATPENLIIAGSGRVTVYADLAVATGKLDARLAADPNDVDASERYAELLFAAGRPKEAIARLDEAAAKLGGLKSMTPGPARDRLFDIAAGFAAKLQRNTLDADLAAQVFDRAAAAARTPPQQVRYRLALAAAYHTAGQTDAELTLHQQILGNAEWRAVTVPGKSGSSTAGAEAEAGVIDLLRGHGSGIYAVYEKAAAERMEMLETDAPADPDALLSIADEFPAASVVPDALTLAADRFEADDQPRSATQTLRRLLRRDLSNERRQVTLQALARNYLRSPTQVAIAQVRLKQAKALAPTAKLLKPLTLPDGKALAATTVAEAAAALDGYDAQARAAALPALAVPLTSDGSDPAKPPLRPAADVAAAAAIVDQQPDIARGDRVVVWGTDRRIGVVAGDSASVQWTDAAPADAPDACGFVGDTLVVVTDAEAVAVDAGGKVLWKTAVAGLPTVDVAAGAVVARERTNVDADANPMANLRGNRGLIIPGRGGFGGGLQIQVQAPAAAVDDAAGGGERFTQSRLLSDRVVLATSTGRVLALDLVTGRAAWQARVSDTGATRLLSNDDFVVAGFVDPGNGSDVYVFDAVTGQTALHKAYDGNTNPQAGGLINVALSPDGVLVTMLGGRLTGLDLYDPGSGEWKFDATEPNGRQLQPFLASGGDAQLVIAGDKVLAVFTGQTNQQSVHAYALRTLVPDKSRDEKSGRETIIAYGARSADVGFNPLTILASGRSFYLVGQRSLAAYDLGRPDATWAALAGAGDRRPTRAVIVARDFVVQIAPTAAAAADADKMPGMLLSMYGRGVTPRGVESGVLEQRPVVNDAAGILAGEWQVVDGAIYYVSGDKKLKVLRANR